MSNSKLLQVNQPKSKISAKKRSTALLLWKESFRRAGSTRGSLSLLPKKSNSDLAMAPLPVSGPWKRGHRRQLRSTQRQPVSRLRNTETPATRLPGSSRLPPQELQGSDVKANSILPLQAQAWARSSEAASRLGMPVPHARVPAMVAPVPDIITTTPQVRSPTGPLLDLPIKGRHHRFEIVLI